MKYDVIYMDPPWDYQGQSQTGKAGISSNVEMHYPTMKDSELMALPVWDMLSDNALVFMWIGSPIMDRALQIAKAWRLKYATVAFVWDKQIVNPGHYTMSQCELCLVFKKGKIPENRGIRNARQFVS